MTLFIVAREKSIVKISSAALILIAAYIVFGILQVSRAAGLNTGGVTNYSILVSIDKKTLYLFESGRRIRDYPIATGMPEWPSPIGQWKIVEKSDWGEGFGGHWMGLN